MSLSRKLFPLNYLFLRLLADEDQFGDEADELSERGGAFDNSHVGESDLLDPLKFDQFRTFVRFGDSERIGNEVFTYS